MPIKENVVRYIEARNAVVVEYAPVIHGEVAKYKEALSAAGIDAEDAFQEATCAVVRGLNLLDTQSPRVVIGCIRRKARDAVAYLMRRTAGQLVDRRRGFRKPGTRPFSKKGVAHSADILDRGGCGTQPAPSGNADHKADMCCTPTSLQCEAPSL